MMVHSPTTTNGLGARPAVSLLDAANTPAGLTEAEFDRIAAALGPRWHLARHRDLGGDALAVILPGDSDTALPSWVVHREGRLLRLDVCRDETYERHGAYPALQPLLASLRGALDAAGR